MDWRTAVITRQGIDLVKLHIARLDQSDANEVMIQRLENILKGALDYPIQIDGTILMKFGNWKGSEPWD